MISVGRPALALLIALGPWSALADPLTRIEPAEAYAQIARSGELRELQIDGDLDVAKMKPPAGATRILLQGVAIEGALHSSAGGPAAALMIEQSTLRDIDLRGTRWSAPFAIENSVVKNRAWFDDTQFDAPFTLHATTFGGQTLFRRARFNAPVEITASTFAPEAPVRASVNFSDARFAAPARFDRSEFRTGVRFDTARFDTDATFLRMSGRASLRNVIFAGDAEFRFCRLDEADFGDEEQLSVFMRLADFRGCRLGSLRLDYADMRGDVLLVNVSVTPGDLTLRQASLRGGRSDFSGLKVAGRLDLSGAQIANLHLQWFDIGPAILRSAPGSDVLRPLQRRLEELKKDDEAREVSALLADRVIDERLAAASPMDQGFLWGERLVWGGATGYGTRLGRIVAVALGCWLVLALPLVFAPGIRIGSLREATEKVPPLHVPVPPDSVQPRPTSAAARMLNGMAYAFALMFAIPAVHLRPTKPLPAGFGGYLLFLRGVGLVLLALMALTLAKVSPVIQAILGKIVA